MYGVSRITSTQVGICELGEISIRQIRLCLHMARLMMRHAFAVIPITMKISMSHWESSGKSSEWYTPPEVFKALDCRFDMDVAAPHAHTHVPAQNFIMNDSLKSQWAGFVWMNPPFGGRNGIKPWLDKFFAHGNGIALVPDRTSAPWFQEAFPKAQYVLFTRKIRFIRPDGTRGISPSNGTALMAVGARGCAAVSRAAHKGFGILCTTNSWI